jgi:nitric oxide reductase NorQ protein
MDDRGHIILTEKDNEIVNRHPFGYIILSFNPYSVEYAGTKPLNVAFRRRVSAWFHFDYLSKATKISEFEVKEVMKRSGLKDEQKVYNMVKAAAELRKLYENGELPMAPSIGNLVCWAKLVAIDDIQVTQAADETIVDTISDDPAIKAIVRHVINSIFVTQ